MLDVEYEAQSLYQNNSEMWFVIVEDNEPEMPVAAPLALFEIIDASVPRSWLVRVEGREVALRPPEYDETYFYDDVQERRDDALERYRAMKARLRGEE